MLNYLKVYRRYKEINAKKKINFKTHYGPNLPFSESTKDKYFLLKHMVINQGRVYIRTVNGYDFLLLKYTFSPFPKYFEAETRLNRNHSKFFKLFFDLHVHNTRIRENNDDTLVMSQGIYRMYLPIQLRDISIYDIFMVFEKLHKQRFTVKLLNKFKEPYPENDPYFWSYDHKVLQAKKAMLDNVLPLSFYMNEDNFINLHDANDPFYTEVFHRYIMRNNLLDRNIKEKVKESNLKHKGMRKSPHKPIVKSIRIIKPIAGPKTIKEIKEEIDYDTTLFKYFDCYGQVDDDEIERNLYVSRKLRFTLGKKEEEEEEQEEQEEEEEEEEEINNKEEQLYNEGQKIQKSLDMLNYKLDNIESYQEDPEVIDYVMTVGNYEDDSLLQLNDNMELELVPIKSDKERKKRIIDDIINKNKTKKRSLYSPELKYFELKYPEKKL